MEIKNTSQEKYVLENENKNLISKIFAVVKVIFSMILLVITAPVMLALWSIKFIKSMILLAIVWIVGKISLYILAIFVIGGISYIGLYGDNQADKILDVVERLLWGAENSRNFNPFWNIEIEIWIMIIISAVNATSSIRNK